MAVPKGRVSKSKRDKRKAQSWKIATPNLVKCSKCGETVTVTKLGGEGALKRRIMDMGITKGTSIFVRKVAPLGDPVEVTVRGYELSLRRSDAENILVD